MRFAHWEWMVRTRKYAFTARKKLGFEPHEDHDPDWCFTNTYSIHPVATCGTAPGWIYKHRASYDEALHAVTVRGGYIGAAGQKPYVGVHRLHLADMRWEELSERELRRRFEIRQLFLPSDPLPRRYVVPSPDVIQFSSVPYQPVPPQPSETLSAVLIGGARVLFQASPLNLDVFIDGYLADEMVQQLLTELTANLSRMSGYEWRISERAIVEAD